MATTLYKKINVCVGAVPTYDGKRMVKRQREIGVVLKHSSGENEWLELRLHADMLNPVLFQQVKGHAMPAGDSMFIATLSDPPRVMKDPTVGPEPGPEPERPVEEELAAAVTEG